VGREIVRWGNVRGEYVRGENVLHSADERTDKPSMRMPRFVERDKSSKLSGEWALHRAHCPVSFSRCEPALDQSTQFQRQSSVTAFDDNHVACSDRLQVLTAPVNRCMPANADASLCAMTVTVTISLALRITTSSALVVSGADNIINLFFSFSQSAI